VQSPNASSTEPGEIIINCSYIKNTTDMGIFVLVHGTDSNKFIYQVGRRNDSSSTSLVVEGLESGSYKLFSYDLERFGLPKDSPAAVPLIVTVAERNSECFRVCVSIAVIIFLTQ